MKDKKRAKLPRGLRWHAESRFIWFTWYDDRGRQRKKSTESSDPEKALPFKIRFLKEREDRQEAMPAKPDAETPDMGNMPLERAARLYFEWKLANNSRETVAREQRLFKNVIQFFGTNAPVRSIRLHKIREYQKDRRCSAAPAPAEPPPYPKQQPTRYVRSSNRSSLAPGWADRLTLAGRVKVSHSGLPQTHRELDHLHVVFVLQLDLSGRLEDRLQDAGSQGHH